MVMYNYSRDCEVPYFAKCLVEKVNISGSSSFRKVGRSLPKLSINGEDLWGREPTIIPVSILTKERFPAGNEWELIFGANEVIKFMKSGSYYNGPLTEGIFSHGVLPLNKEIAIQNRGVLEIKYSYLYSGERGHYVVTFERGEPRVIYNCGPKEARRVIASDTGSLDYSPLTRELLLWQGGVKFSYIPLDKVKRGPLVEGGQLVYFFDPKVIEDVLMSNTDSLDDSPLTKKIIDEFRLFDNIGIDLDVFHKAETVHYEGIDFETEKEVTPTTQELTPVPK